MSPEVVLRLVLDEGDRLIDEGFEEEPAAVGGVRESFTWNRNQIMKFQDFDRSMSICVNYGFWKSRSLLTDHTTSWKHFSLDSHLKQFHAIVSRHLGSVSHSPDLLTYRTRHTHIRWISSVRAFASRQM